MNSRAFVIREAEHVDRRAFRMLLPGLTQPAFRLVVCDASTGRVVGAAALLEAMRPRPPVGPGVALHVVAPWRRQGVGKALIAEFAAAAHRRGAEAIYAMQRVDADSDAHRNWQLLGFVPLEHVVEHELCLTRVIERLTPLWERIVAHQWTPPDARVVSLCDADRREVAELHLREMGGDRRDQQRKLRGEGVGAYQQVYSRVLLLGRGDRPKVVGCLLARRQDRETALVEANIVDREVRGGWANVWLKLEAARGAQSLGIKKFVFRTFDRYQDTRAFTEQVGGKRLRTQLLMHRPLEVCGERPAGDR